MKLLKHFLFNPDKDFFIRELTRILDEQINSIRRELDNLKKVGLLKSRMKNRKKYFYVNKNFIILDELKKIFSKAISAESNITKSISSFGDIVLLIFAGTFVNSPNSKVDLLIVGKVRQEELENYLDEDLQHSNLRYTIISKDEFLYRLGLNDRFIKSILDGPNNIITINKIKKEIEKI